MVRRQSSRRGQTGRVVSLTTVILQDGTTVPMHGGRIPELERATTNRAACSERRSRMDANPHRWLKATASTMLWNSPCQLNFAPRRRGSAPRDDSSDEDSIAHRGTRRRRVPDQGALVSASGVSRSSIGRGTSSRSATRFKTVWSFSMARSTTSRNCVPSLERKGTVLTDRIRSHRPGTGVGPRVFRRPQRCSALAIWDVDAPRLCRPATRWAQLSNTGTTRAPTFGSRDSRAAGRWATPRRRSDPVALNLFLNFRYTPRRSPCQVIREARSGQRCCCREGRVPRERW